ncbi:hypothetical protein [Parvularcula sp. LCG005]|uniref:hypothetical protein n=1 Tax=Parvularcula sp. LCG005 TaxID=3078805 RepID=UPI002943D68C|nr:hypothetical protein [Parvularcula sp. LCG005]WOI53942.1 hypothetical protein RUI03_02810 [Parvularcula sp. LCG005]
MADKPSHSRVRIALAQFCYSHSIDLEDLLAALGVTGGTDAEAMAHMAGVLDGMNIAASRIREHGLDNWARSN